MKNWIKYGLFWGLCMLIGMTILFPLIDGNFSITKVLIGIPVFVGFGLLWGYLLFRKQTNKKITES